MMESHGRKSMNKHDAPAPTSGRQMSLIFEPRRVDGMSKAERTKAVILLAQILMQAAGLVVEELGDDRS
ncbi:hypothetical protein NX02_19830 [Sphingomonas sanxanigenens DSM 19645 = NX02]|uniref:Uncharacterized protein n=2 Tax=Sphingomonas sanxanigenens TaxID=397260 RepID=W0AIZ2_9SPHN|nr:hypothetical protein NX02_19830 [Sphingomonas sanxanigenens DSM 19645 = NX02]